MRLIVFFDLPTTSNKDLAEYRSFRKYLLKNGFVMLQESVYCKLALNNGSLELVKKQLKKNLPSGGLVQVLTVTENQFEKMEFLVGEKDLKVVDSMQRIIKL
ncbi:MAG: CRISPR-associated endonuclease Cas2 [Clostridia bacterium]|nr:CRISPR-associated endonuclease Cas2 [Clostridia bacterium]